MNRSIVVLLLPILVSCSGGTWSSEKQDEFLAECKDEGGSNSYCKCFLYKVMEHYPNPADAEKMDFETAVELASQCD